jgi:hypothetical protein
MRFVFLATLLSSTAFAQSFYGTLRGRILDPKGAAAAAATVTLTDESKWAGRKSFTDVGDAVYFMSQHCESRKQQQTLAKNLFISNFQSLRLALTVLLTVPAVLCGVLLMLFLTRTTLSVQSFMGAIMAIGVAVANAILFVTFSEFSRKQGMAPADAAVEGGQSRARAILMTAAAMICGMIPMALGVSESGKQTAPVARAVIGGLAAATISTLFVLPSIYSILQSRSRLTSPSLNPYDPEAKRIHDHRH